MTIDIEKRKQAISTCLVLTAIHIALICTTVRDLRVDIIARE
jgi:hypothetical protein